MNEKQEFEKASETFRDHLEKMRRGLEEMQRMQAESEKRLARILQTDNKL